MNLIRRLAIPAIAAVAVLSGTPTALAATTSATAQSAPAAPAHVVAADRAAPAAAPDAPASYHWIEWNSTWYGTAQACNSAGDWVKQHVNSGYTFNCVGMNGGEFVYYRLWVGIPN